MEILENYSHKTTTLQILVKTDKGFPVCVVTMDAKNYCTRDKETYDILIDRLYDCIKKLYNAIN